MHLVCTLLIQARLTFFNLWVASQAAWYRMENGPKSKNGKKNWPKNRKWPSARNGEKWPKNGEKMEFGVVFYFFTIFGPFFPHFGPRAIFYFSANFFLHFWISAHFPFQNQAAWLEGNLEICQSSGPQGCSFLPRPPKGPGRIKNTTT